MSKLRVSDRTSLMDSALHHPYPHVAECWKDIDAMNYECYAYTIGTTRTSNLATDNAAKTVGVVFETDTNLSI